MSTMYDAGALVGVDNLRADGRRTLECREIRVGLGGSLDEEDNRLPMTMLHADGSCEWRQGLTSVLVTVYGPHEPLSSAGSASTSSDASSMRMAINCEVHQAPSSSSMLFGTRSSRPDRRLQELTIRLKDSLESIIITSEYSKSGTRQCCKSISLHAGKLQVPPPIDELM